MSLQAGYQSLPTAAIMPPGSNGRDGGSVGGRGREQYRSQRLLEAAPPTPLLPAPPANDEGFEDDASTCVGDEGSVISQSSQGDVASRSSEASYETASQVSSSAGRAAVSWSRSPRTSGRLETSSSSGMSSRMSSSTRSDTSPRTESPVFHTTPQTQRSQLWFPEVRLPPSPQGTRTVDELVRNVMLRLDARLKQSELERSRTLRLAARSRRPGTWGVDEEERLTSLVDQRRAEEVPMIIRELTKNEVKYFKEEVAWQVAALLNVYGKNAVAVRDSTLNRLWNLPQEDSLAFLLRGSEELDSSIDKIFTWLGEHLKSEGYCRTCPTFRGSVQGYRQGHTTSVPRFQSPVFL
ncbi:hypothetical protein QBC46DRAFT_430642, partial [Diplogelasinospora grovesii]